MLNIRKALKVPVVQRDSQSYNAHFNYQIILPTPSAENLFQGGNHLTHFSASAAMSVYQVGSLCSVEAYEALERYAGNDPKATRKFPSTARNSFWYGEAGGETQPWRCHGDAANRLACDPPDLSQEVMASDAAQDVGLAAQEVEPALVAA